MKKEFSTYSVIPTEIILNKEISSTSKLLYGLISSLSNEKGYCWASNDYLGELLSVSGTRTSLLIKELIEAGLIESKVEKNYKREIRLKGVLTKVKGGINKTKRGVLTKVKDNNIIEYNNIIHSETSSQDEFSSEEYIKGMLENKNKHIQLIAKYFISKGLVFPSKIAIQSDIRRWVKDARVIVEYPQEQVNKTFSYVLKEFPDVWNLSTIRKFISKQ